MAQCSACCSTPCGCDPAPDLESVAATLNREVPGWGWQGPNPYHDPSHDNRYDGAWGDYLVSVWRHPDGWGWWAKDRSRGSDGPDKCGPAPDRSSYVSAARAAVAWCEGQKAPAMSAPATPARTCGRCSGDGWTRPYCLECDRPGSGVHDCPPPFPCHRCNGKGCTAAVVQSPDSSEPPAPLKTFIGTDAPACAKCSDTGQVGYGLKQHPCICPAGDIEPARSCRHGDTIHTPTCDDCAPRIRVVTAVIAKPSDRSRYLCTLRTADRDYPLHWEMPGGKSERGETPNATARREVGEELGLFLHHVGDGPMFVCDFKPPATGLPTRIAFHVANVYPDAVPVPRQVLGYAWLTLEELRRLPTIPGLRRFLESTVAAKEGVDGR